MTMEYPGFFISFEGGEGSGKTTQINKLAQTLTGDKHVVLTTREPGGTPEGERIRDLIVQRSAGNWSPMAETLLISAARTMHVENIIKPALEEGKVVITDRFTDSTLAYQGYGRGLPLEEIDRLNDLILKGLQPDLTFVLDIDPETGLTRSKRRLSSEQLGIEQTEDRFEQFDLDFHKKIREAFLDIAQKDQKRYRVISAEQSIDAIADQILAVTRKALNDGPVR